MIDLTPFGFTHTESMAYGTLLELGPATGYRVAREMNVARANAYHALEGLVAKGAAGTVGEDPRRYRAVRPDSVFALILERTSGNLDQLESELLAEEPVGEDRVIRLESRRALLDLLTRRLVRESEAARIAGPGDLLASLNQAFRARAAKGFDLEVAVTDGSDPDLPVPHRAASEEWTDTTDAGKPTLVFTSPGFGIAARNAGDEISALASTDPIFVCLTGETQDRIFGQS